MLTFTPGGMSTLCSKIQIIDDMIVSEPNEQFSVKLISAFPVGTIGEDTSCITIIDDDRKLKVASYSRPMLEIIANNYYYIHACEITVI